MLKPTQKPRRSNLIIGVLFVVFALVTAFVWIPFDTTTGLVEKVRGRQIIGDALAPIVACGFLLIGGLLLLVSERNASDQPSITCQQLRFLALILTSVIGGLFVMRFAGPVAVEIVSLTRSDALEYRLLRATPGWKHIGFVLGGTLAVAGMISVVERRVSLRAVLTGVGAVLAMVALFDLPFEDLLLPPNGDV